jgi:hypothetical protein
VITSTTQGDVPGEGEESTGGDACGISVVFVPQPGSENGGITFKGARVMIFFGLEVALR